MPQTIELKCPVCQTPASKSIETTINCKERPDLKKAILDGSLMGFECDHCGAKRQIETQVLYHDPDQKTLMFVAPDYHKEPELLRKTLALIVEKEGIDINDYRLRIMTSVPQLVEKIYIFDEGMDDQEMEIVKILTDGLFAQQEPNRTVINRYFMVKDGQKKFLYLTEDEQLLVDYHPTLTEFVVDKFGKDLKEQYLGEFIEVNKAWATNLANHLPGNHQGPVPNP